MNVIQTIHKAYLPALFNLRDHDDNVDDVGIVSSVNNPLRVLFTAGARFVNVAKVKSIDPIGQANGDNLRVRGGRDLLPKIQPGNSGGRTVPVEALILGHAIAPGRDSVSAEIAAHLEKLIAIGELAPGDRLPSERDLAIGLGVSRASLREAMHELQSKHLVERRPGRGTTVMPMPERVSTLYAELSDAEHQLRDVAELRETIEPKLAELAALRATPANLVALKEVLRRSITNATPDESLRYDLEFHMLLAAASQNPLMSAINTLAGSWTCTTRVLSHSTRYAREVSYLGHRSILAAVTAGSAEGAREAMRRHLGEVASMTQETFEDMTDGGK